MMWTNTASISSSSLTTTSSATNLYVVSSSSAITMATPSVQIVHAPIPWRDLVVPDRQSAHITLPDGTKINVDKDGSFEINDQAAKVIYRASRIREFNPFVNASDKIEDFIRFCGDQGIRQGEMLDLPIKLFIGWLIIEAAKADREPEPDVPLIPDLRRHTTPRCLGCGRFIRRDAATKGLFYCSSGCLEKAHRKNGMRQ